MMILQTSMLSIRPLSSRLFRTKRIIKLPPLASNSNSNSNDITSLLQKKLFNNDNNDNDNNDNTDSTVFIKNTQKTIHIDIEAVREHALKVKSILGVSNFHVDIWFCSEQKIRSLNKEWREKAKSTDVLSFPVNDFTKPGIFADDGSIEHVKHLGDIVIAPSYVQRQCHKDEEYNKMNNKYDNDNDDGVSLAMSTTFDTNQRIILLLVHGMIHLLGYDHENQKDWFQMTRKENEVLKKIGLLKD